MANNQKTHKMSQNFYIILSYLTAIVIIGSLISRSVSRFNKARRNLARTKAQKGSNINSQN